MPVSLHPAWPPMRRLLLLATVIVYPAVASARAPRQAAPKAIDQTLMISREIAILEFAANAPLAPDERRQVADDVRMALQTAPAQMTAWNKSYANLLARIPTLQPGDAEAERARQRIDPVFPRSAADDVEPISSTARRILEAHDPVVALDAVKRRLVTERSLFVLRNAAAWTAQKMGLPGPDDTFIDRARAMVRANYPALPDEVSRGIALIAGNARYEAAYLKHIVPAKREAFFAATRSAFAAVRDPAEQQWWLARSTATFAESAAKVQAQKTQAMQNMTLQTMAQHFGMFNSMKNFGDRRNVSANGVMSSPGSCVNARIASGNAGGGSGLHVHYNGQPHTDQLWRTFTTVRPRT